MILISRKVDYAILALIHLMKSKEGFSARQVAAQYNLSRPFLANILKELCHHGFIESHRGIHGGYKLVRDPAQVTMDEIISALDGPFQLMSCAREDGEGACGLVDVCPVKGPLRVVHERMAAVLVGTTLEDLGRSESPLVTLTMENEQNGHASDLPG
ncbi:Rrf2 family transcriptional regulator [bacterium]|jgi:Rrf2 family transcriptional regulator, cysteine metabolism repressor|nr:Rrf2 family transcriptional regulator [bacterium]